MEVLESRIAMSLAPQLFVDLNTDTLSSTPRDAAAVGSTLYFTANDGMRGIELWKSDGTAAGTALVKDIIPGSTGSYPSKLTAVGGTLYFVASDNENGRSLWKTDGTAAGTVLVKAPSPDGGGAEPGSLTGVGNTLFFTAVDSKGLELWKSDGTSAGTVRVKDIDTRAGLGSTPTNLTAVGGNLFFTATTGTKGTELWKSDGTAAGTVLVKDIIPGSAGSYPASLTNVNGKLFFTAYTHDFASELWKSDGTAAGTVVVKEIGSGPAGSQPYELTNVDGTLYFTAEDGVHSRELWRSDGTAAGTTLVKDINSGTTRFYDYLGNPYDVPIGSFPGQLTSVNGALLFTADDGAHGRELWKSDGTASGTKLVKDIAPAAVTSPPYQLTNVNGLLFFTADTPATGRELWRSDGTAAGTSLVKEIVPGVAQSYQPYLLAAVGGTLYFSANDLDHGWELWRSDGAAMNTMLVKDVNAVSLSSNPSLPLEVDGVIYFTADDGAHGTELWRSDGTVAGTTLVKDIHTGLSWDIYSGYSNAGSQPSNLTNVDGTLYFTADDGLGLGIWKSDGTAAGTNLVSRTPQSLAYLTNVNGLLYFTADEGVHGRELWKSDGTVAGTTLVKDINPGTTRHYDYYGNPFDVPSGSFPSRLTSANGTLFFMADDGVHGRELWKSDGTAAGTIMVKDVDPTASAGSWQLVKVGATVYFTADDGVHGQELWRSDGTAAGTTLVKDVNPGANGSNIFDAALLNGVLYFRASTDANGNELWRSDGTAAGTTLVKDIVPGVGNSYPGGLAVVGGIVYFTATREMQNRELWKSDGTAAGTTLVKDFGPYSWLDSLTDVDGTLFFRFSNADGLNLWKSDGTAAGTTLVTSLAPIWIANVGGELFLSADDGLHGTEMFRIIEDGSPPPPPPPTLRIADVSVVEGHSGRRTATFTVTLSSASTGPVTVNYSTVDGTASSPSDYVAASGSLTFAAGETTKTITISVKGDRLGEPNETFFINLTAASNATILDGQGVGTIVDDESRVSINDVVRAEGDSGTITFVFTVSLSTPYDASVTVRFATSDGTAKTSDNDYFASSGSLTFAPGQTQKTVTIKVRGDRRKESNETFFVNLSEAKNSLILKSRGIGTIVNDDGDAVRTSSAADPLTGSFTRRRSGRAR